MPANRTKAQVAKVYKDAGIMQPTMKLEGAELQARLGQRSVKFADKRTGRLKTRSAQKRRALADY